VIHILKNVVESGIDAKSVAALVSAMAAPVVFCSLATVGAFGRNKDAKSDFPTRFGHQITEFTGTSECDRMCTY